MKFFPKSIRWRIQLWHTLLLAVIIAALLGAFYKNQREIAYQALDRELNSPITSLLPRLERGRGPAPRNRRLPRPGDDGPREFFEEGPRENPGRGPRRRPDDGPELEERFRGPDTRSGPTIEEVVAELMERDIFVIAWDRNSRLRYSSENAPEELTPIPDERPNGGQQVFKRTSGNYREVIHANPGGGFLLVGTSIVPVEEKLSNLGKKLGGIGVLLVGGGFMVGWLLVTRSLKPIKAISDTAHRIEDGNLSARIESKKDGSELGMLSKVLNETFEKLESSFEHQVRFTADASHEMRTPIAVILAKSQFALSRERSPEKYQEALKTCMDSAQHMRTLTESLLELSKVDSGEFRLKKENHDLGKFTLEVVDMIRPLADKKGIKISCSVDPVTASFDLQKMRQVLLNLLSNAVKYNREEGEIEVILTEENQFLTLSIRDTGSGISEERLPHVFERFYRVDRARTRDGVSGTGLGLAITRAIIEAHGGEISASSQIEKGSTFQMILPK